MKVYLYIFLLLVSLPISGCIGKSEGYMEEKEIVKRIERLNEVKSKILCKLIYDACNEAKA